MPIAVDGCFPHPLGRTVICHNRAAMCQDHVEWNNRAYDRSRLSAEYVRKDARDFGFARVRNSEMRK